MKLRFMVSALLGLILLVFLYGGCDSDITSSGSKPSFAAPDFSKTDPLAFLDILKNHPEAYTTMPSTIAGLRDWVREEHVAQLMQLIDSQEPAAIVRSPTSSQIPLKSDASTVGEQAMFLIEGFKKGSYPPVPTSLGYFEYDPDEYREWWRKYQREKSEDK